MSQAGTQAGSRADADDRLRFYSWPKMVALWPTMVAALIFGLLNYWSPDRKDTWGGLFLLIMSLNMLVLTFEFPRATWITVILFVVVLVMVLHLLGRLTWLLQVISLEQISASTGFYLTFFGVLAVLFILMAVGIRFNYWELTENELLHRQGPLADVERYSTDHLRYQKEIPDVFEHIIFGGALGIVPGWIFKFCGATGKRIYRCLENLGGAGTLILYIPGQPRPIVLENVLRINHVFSRLNSILEAKRIRVEGGIQQLTGEFGVNPPQ